MMKRVSASTLRRKCKKWQKFLNLDDWKIRIKYPSKKDLRTKKIDQDDLACVHCNSRKLEAVIIVNNDYYKDCQNEFLNNTDMVILHELIHILLDEPVATLAMHIQENTKLKELEEYVCNIFAIIIYNRFYCKK